MKPICDIIILTWNRADLIRSCVDSFLHCTDIPCRLIIVDNGSTDDTGVYLASLRDNEKCRFKVIRNTENNGFVEGTNQGMAIADAEYVCLANNDLIFTKGWLDEMIAVFQRDRRIGLLNPNSNNLGIHVPNNCDMETFADELKKAQKNTFIEMPFCIGFCMVMRRSVIDQVGLLSQEFAPAFFEDSDFSLRVKKAGHLIGMANRAYVWHKEHASFDLIGERRKDQIFTNSRNIFEKKWGKVLRLAWVANSRMDAGAYLEEILSYARRGNFIHILTQEDQADHETIFSDMGRTPHSGIGFFKFSNMLTLLWKILKKKKKYHILVLPKKYCGVFTFFKFVHQAEIVNSLDAAGLESVYKKIKRAEEFF